MASLKKISDFTIRIIMLFMTIITIYYFASIYNQIIFTIIGLLFMLAIIVKGALDIFRKD